MFAVVWGWQQFGVCYFLVCFRLGFLILNDGVSSGDDAPPKVDVIHVYKDFQKKSKNLSSRHPPNNKKELISFFHFFFSLRFNPLFPTVDWLHIIIILLAVWVVLVLFTTHIRLTSQCCKRIRDHITASFIRRIHIHSGWHVASLTNHNIHGDDSQTLIFQ